MIQFDRLFNSIIYPSQRNDASTDVIVAVALGAITLVSSAFKYTYPLLTLAMRGSVVGFGLYYFFSRFFSNNRRPSNRDSGPPGGLGLGHSYSVNLRNSSQYGSLSPVGSTVLFSSSPSLSSQSSRLYSGASYRLPALNPSAPSLDEDDDPAMQQAPQSRSVGRPLHSNITASTMRVVQTTALPASSSSTDHSGPNLYPAAAHRPVVGQPFPNVALAPAAAPPSLSSGRVARHC